MYFLPISGQCNTHNETSQLICLANQLTGFYMSVALACYEFKITHYNIRVLSLMFTKTRLTPILDQLLGTSYISLLTTGPQFDENLNF